MIESALISSPLFLYQVAWWWGVEVLARWIEKGSIINPAQFIPAAEQAGLLDKLLDSVMEQAFRAASRWPAHMFIALNISPTQLHNPDLPRRLTDAA